MHQFIAPRMLWVNGQPSPCECSDGVVCAYCVQANLAIANQERQGVVSAPREEVDSAPRIVQCSSSALECTPGNPCNQHGRCMRCWNRVATLQRRRERKKSLKRIKAEFAREMKTPQKSKQRQGLKDNSSISLLGKRAKKLGKRAVARELGVDHKTISSWFQKGTIPRKYFNDGELVGKEAISEG